jgi:hypothetical protein
VCALPRSVSKWGVSERRPYSKASYLIALASGNGKGRAWSVW